MFHGEAHSVRTHDLLAIDANVFIAENTLSALLARNVLTLGMDVLCSECGQTTWFALEHLGPKLKCGRCLREFDFPLTEPQKIPWSYRVQGPFAVENFAHGAYCVAFALLFLGLLAVVQYILHR